MARLLFVLALMTQLAGCREIDDAAFVEISGRIFVFNYRVATATYVVTLAKLRPLPEDATVQAVFDNPEGGDPIIVTQKIWPKLDKIAIESPPIFCIKKDVPYRFVVDLKSSDGSVLQKLNGTVISSLDQSVMPDLPLVVGPAYTPNPDLAGSPSGKLSNIEHKKCK